MDYAWERREEFRRVLLRVRGASSAFAFFEPGNRFMGRYPRTRVGEEEGRTLTVHPHLWVRGKVVNVDPTLLVDEDQKLVGVPFGTQEEIKEAYAFLISCGVVYNDATEEETAAAAAAIAAFKAANP